VQRPPRRPIPTDLRGKCFNCFSPDHCAANCRSMTCCFHCRDLGHRSSGCPWQSSGSRLVVPRPQHLVWRPKSVAAEHGAPPVTSAARGEVPEGSQGRKRRRRTRRKGHSGPRRSADDDRQESREDGGGCHNPGVSSGDNGAAMDADYSRPRRILDRCPSCGGKTIWPVRWSSPFSMAVLIPFSPVLRVDLRSRFLRCPFSASGMRGSS
jgi:hypothetical protein